MSERMAYVSGRVVPLDEARVSVLDRGLLYGDGLFETIRVSGGRCIRLDRHLERLRSGSELLRLDAAPTDAEAREIIDSVLEANGLRDARIRLTLTRGESTGPGRLGADHSDLPTVIVTADPLPASRPMPADVVISSVRRDETSPLSSAKTLNYLPSILARMEAEEAGADDAILLNSRGMVSDGVTGNVFLVRDARLATPSPAQGPLPGTARAALIEIAPSIGLEVVETEIDPRELTLADEVFFTNAVQLVRPIRSVSGEAVRGSATRVGNLVYAALLGPASG